MINIAGFFSLIWISVIIGLSVALVEILNKRQQLNATAILKIVFVSWPKIVLENTRGKL